VDTRTVHAKEAIEILERTSATGYSLAIKKTVRFAEAPVKACPSSNTIPTEGSSLLPGLHRRSSTMESGKRQACARVLWRPVQEDGREGIGDTRSRARREKKSARKEKAESRSSRSSGPRPRPTARPESEPHTLEEEPPRRRARPRSACATCSPRTSGNIMSAARARLVGSGALGGREEPMR